MIQNAVQFRSEKGFSIEKKQSFGVLPVFESHSFGCLNPNW